MMQGPVATDGGKRVPFVFEKGDVIQLDLSTHKYKVIYKPENGKRRFICFSSYNSAYREVRDNPGSVLQILGDVA